MSSDLRPNAPISNNIHWIKDRFVNAYIINNGDSLTLIDTAFNKKARIILDYVKSELENKPLETIYLTHHHSDHTGGLYALNEHYHPHVYSSKIDGEVITGKRKPPSPRGILRIIYPLVKPFFTARPITSTEILEDQQKIKNFEVFHLPGHTMGSLGFLQEKIFFVGDACRINNEGKIIIGAKAFTESMDQAKESLQKISKMKFDVIFAGHGTPILNDADMRVQDAVERIIN